MQLGQGPHGGRVRRAEKNFGRKEFLRRVRQLARDPVFAGIFATWPALGHLLGTAEAALERSSQDVFPFHLREVERYHQLADILAAARSLLKDLTTSEAVGNVPPQEHLLRNFLTRLEGIIAPLAADPAVAAIVSALEGTNEVFCKVREILGRDGQSGEQVRVAMHAFLATLANDPARAPVYAELSWRLEYYDRELYVAYDNPHVPRTNNALEDFNKAVKRPIRKCRGQKDSWFYLEHDAAGVATYHNLLHAPYVVGGTDIASPEDVSPLERAHVLPAMTVTSVMNLVNYEHLAAALEKHDGGYAVHRWTRRINKLGLVACLQMISMEFKATLNEVHNTKVGIKTGED